MIRHTVLFALEGFPSEEAKKEQLQQIKQALEALPAAIDALLSMKVYINCNPEEPYDFLLEATLASMEELPLYAEHPRHQQVVAELIKPYMKLRAAIDCTL